MALPRTTTNDRINPVISKIAIFILAAILLLGIIWFSNDRQEYIPAPYEIVKPVQLVVGRPDNPLVKPIAVANNDQGEVFVLDASKKQVLVFSENGRYLRKFSGLGSGLAELKEPSGLAVAPNGNVYVSDMARQVVIVFGAKGNYLFTIKDNYKDSFVPSGLAVTAEGKLIVYNHANKGFRIFDKKGKLLKEVGSKTFSLSSNDVPKYLTIVEKKGRILLSDPATSQVGIFDMEGKRLDVLGKGILNKPQGIAYNDKFDRIFVTDMVKHRILVFNTSWKYIGEFGCYGTAMKEFKNPMGLGAGKSGKISVADLSNRRVVIYGF